MNTTTLFNDNWLFSETELDKSLSQVTNWTNVEIPHDFLIHDTNNLYESAIGWYKKEFDINYFDPTKENLTLRFEGVYQDCTIIFNGEQISQWKYGYTTFEVDLSKYVQQHNTLIVKVVYQSPNSRWYSGAGIYRNVYIKRRNINHIKSDGVYIHTHLVSDNDWLLTIDTDIQSEPNTQYDIVYTIFNKDNELLTQKKDKISTNKHTTVLEIHNPQLWDVQSPHNRYNVVVTLYLDEVPIDTQTHNIGFRTLLATTEQGLFLNGNRIELKGVCQHHDLGSLGSAFNKKALKRQLQLLKNMGVNAIRTSHNPPDKELMNLADEMGFLICSEILDMWEMPKTEFDYSKHFNEWIERDIRSWVCRDRNHASLLMWSIGNEIADSHHSGIHGVAITEFLSQLVHKFDYMNNAPCTIGSNYLYWDNAQKCSNVLKYSGYNYAEVLYQEHHNKYPDWYIYGSETSSLVSSRGIYHFPLSTTVLVDDDEQCSALGNSPVSWGAQSLDRLITSHRNLPFLLGQFLWTGTDYIGEPTPYHTRNSYFGQIDTAGFPKDAFYFLQAEWTDYKTNPMIHIFPYWDFSENQIIDVRVTSNAPVVELYFNDTLIGKREIDHQNGLDLIPTWQIPYTKGTLKAIAYDESNNIIATDIQSSFDDPTKIILKTSDLTLQANGTDLAFIEISTVDENNNPVHNATNRVNVKVSGVGRLIGLDNGDSTDYDQYKGTSKRLFSGKLLAIIAPTYETGTITVEVSSLSLPTTTLNLKTIECPLEVGLTTYLDNNPTTEPINEIPIRKIQLQYNTNVLDKNTQEVTVHALTHPTNTTYDNLDWRVTNIYGANSNVATIEHINNNAIKLIANGDGEFFLRCSTRNGNDKTDMYTSIPFTVKDFSPLSINPYEYVSATLYTNSTNNLGNSYERGIASHSTETTLLIYENVDFGTYGSNSFTIDIHAADYEPFVFNIWSGVPGQINATKLGALTYDSGHIWSVYIPATYTLDTTLTGLQTITFEFTNFSSIRGFQFHEQQKAYQKLFVATDNNGMYGDTFNITANGIENIGNNVSITFTDMNFINGTSAIEICGFTPNDVCSLQVRFVNKDGDTIINEFGFTKSTDYTTQIFEFPTISGEFDITFIFLPGCNFNFKYFKFN